MLLNCSKDFAFEEGVRWLNTASEGPIPLIAQKALEEAAFWKLSPNRLSIQKFQVVPIQLKQALATLIGADVRDIILGNSATYGLHLLANGLPLRANDDVILMQNDFPTDILPWLSLTKKGISVRQIKSQGEVLTYTEIERALTPTTKVICLPYVHSFSGHTVDIPAISQLCKAKNILLVVNVSQVAGIRPLNISTLGADAIVCAGYKWLLGPYGTGFCWIRPEVRQTLDYPQNYWISLMDEYSINLNEPLTLNDDHSTRRYDMFGTANFFNYYPWTASINYLLDVGIERIAKHNEVLNQSLMNMLDPSRFTIISPLQDISPIVVFSHQDPTRNKAIQAHLAQQKFFVALWKNNLRVSPHLYNNQYQINSFIKALHDGA